MKIYIAGSYNDRARIKQEAEKFHPDLVVGRWWDEGYFLEQAWDKDMEGHVAQAMGMVDYYHVLEADTTIVDTLSPTTTGGREVEFGIALGLGKETIRIGPCRNVFHKLATIHYSTWEWFWKASWTSIYAKEKAKV